MRRLTQPIWMLAQVAAIGGLFYIEILDAADKKLDAPLGFLLFMDIAIVAFLTGLIAFTWDAIVRRAKGHPKPPPWDDDGGPGDRGKAFRLAREAEAAKARQKGLRQT